MATKDDEEESLRSVALQNAQAVLAARRRAEEALRKQSEWLRVTLASIGDAVISTDDQGLITFMNGVAESLTGWRHAEAMGRPLPDVFHIVNEHTRLPVENPALRALRLGTVVGLANHTILIARDGIERPIDDSAAPIRNDQGEVGGVVLVFRDITRRKAEEAAQAEQNRLVALRADASTAIASEQPSPIGLHQCCEALVRHLDVSFARIWTLNEKDTVLELQASAGLYTHLNGPHGRVPIGQFKIGRIASSRQPHLTNAVLDDPNISDRDWAAREGMVSFAGYPLLVEDRVVGVVAIFARRPLSERVLTELGPLADAIAQFIDRRRTEERFRQQSELHRITLACVGDAVITTDTHGQITNLNAVAEALTGWLNDEAVGQPLHSVFRIVNEVTRLPVTSPASRALEEGVVVGLANHTILIAKDGSERPIDDSAAPIRRGDGVIVGCVLVFRDVTGRRNQERELESREQQFRTLAESIPQMAWMANPDGHIFWYNRRWYDYTGTTIEQMAGWGWQSLHDPQVLPRVMESWKECIATGERFDMVFPLKGADGGFRRFLTRVVPIKDDEGHITRWFGSNTDIHDQQLTEDKLRQLAADLSEADRRKDEFLATLAHELRNPLAPIRNGLQLMRLADGKWTIIEQARAMMERQMTQLVRLVDDLMDVSRITRGKLELRKERVHLAMVLNSAVETSRPVIDGMGHELTVTLPRHPIILDADLTRLAQVFLNLLNNAAKYSERGGHIWLTAVRQQNEVVVSVKDTGVGITADQLPRVFEMFTQIDQSLEKAQGGLGIGLTIVKRLVDLHGGSIEAKSDGPGKGSEFVVRLPVALEANHPNAFGGGSDEATAKSCLRILIVDDNRDGADSLAMMLSVMGNDTRTAYDGEEAVAAAREFQPDVILLDIGLPKLNGYDACRRIQELRWARKPVIIAQTGWGQDEDRQRTREAGFDHHLVKPVDSSALMRLLALV